MRSEKDRAPVFVVAFLFLTRLRARGGRSDETRCGDRPIPNTHTAANYSCDRPNYPPLPPRPSSRTQAGANPFEGLTPRVPQGDTLAFGSESFCRLEEVGLGQAASCAFMLVAGGLGERLGYSGIKARCMPSSFICSFIRGLFWVLRGLLREKNVERGLAAEAPAVAATCLAPPHPLLNGGLFLLAPIARLRSRPSRCREPAF